MKKINVVVSLLMFSLVSIGWANDSTTYNTDHPTGTSTEGTYPKPLMKTDRQEARMHRRSMAANVCDSTDLQCLHNLKTGPGQDSYGPTY